MKFYQKLDGGVLCSAREYDVARSTAIAEGQVVKLSDGLVVPVATPETGAILGVAAESHSGVADALNPRANGARILVIDDPGAVYQCKAPEVAQSDGTASATTLIATAATLATFADDDFNGGYVRLVRKAADSTNADPVGRVRRITDFTAATNTFTLESGGTPCEGDVYAVFPPVGFAKGGLGSAHDTLGLRAATALPMRVVGGDRALGTVWLAAKKHVFAVDA